MYRGGMTETPTRTPRVTDCTVPPGEWCRQAAQLAERRSAEIAADPFAGIPNWDAEDGL